MSRIPAELVEAYRKARYRVAAEPPFELAVGVPSLDADRLMERARASSAALLTAYNPRSRKQAAPENEAAQASLKAALGSRERYGAEGRGEGWPPEPSEFVLGLSRSEAGALARRFDQHAYLYLEPGRPVELVLTDGPA